jgi:hypothetical protein
MKRLSGGAEKEAPTHPHLPCHCPHRFGITRPSQIFVSSGLPEVATEWKIGATVPTIFPVPGDDEGGNNFLLSGL